MFKQEPTLFKINWEAPKP